MTTAPAPGSMLDQAQRLVCCARLLPADAAAKALETAITVLQAAQADILIDAERSGELKDSGCATVRTFAQTVLRRSVNDASTLARIAQHLVDFPQLAAAFRAGEVSTGNLRVVIDHLRPCGLAGLQANEHLLVDLVTRTGPSEVKAFCQQIADLHRPDRDQAKAKALGLRSVRISRVGDLAHVDAMLDPVVADQLKATLAAMAKASRRASRRSDATLDAGSSTEAGPAVALPSYPERRATALEDLILRGIADPDRPARGNTTATVTVDLQTLLGMPGHGQAVLARFGLIPARTAARVSCEALVRLVVKHGNRVLNVGRSQRLVTGRQRAALAATYATCVVPGCGVRFADCDIHHLWWWQLHGPTDLDLQVPLCRSHHAWLHEGSYTLTREHGLLVFRDPRGRTITNTTDLLADQLDLLHQQHASRPASRHGQRPQDPEYDGWAAQPPAFPLGPPAPAAPPDTPTEAELDEAATAEATAALQHLDGWAATPYRRGTWGWTGPNPAPPPGHAPPNAN